MKIIISAFMVFIGSVLSAQTGKPETIYKQIPPIPDKFLCENADSYAETIALLESLSVQLEEIRLTLSEELEIEGDETYNAISAEFPTDEELKRIEKLSEAEQEAFWKKFEETQSQTNNAIAYNPEKYKSEKESLNKRLAEYQNNLLAISEELSDIHYAAMKRKSDKSQNIYNTCMANNSLSAYGKEQIQKIETEFCREVSPIFLKKLNFEYSNLEQNLVLQRRLMLIELMEFSTLTEEELKEQNASLLDLNEIEILSQFLSSYKQLFDNLPGSPDKLN